MILNRKSPDVFKDVAEFTELAQPDMLVPFGAPTELAAVQLAIKLFEEEGIKEYFLALQQYLNNPSRENLIAVADGGMDTIYVIAWAMRVLNVPAQAMWNEVQRSNMAKFLPIAPVGGVVEPLDLPLDACELNIRNGHFVITRCDTGKVVKPKGWTPPALHTVLLEAEQIHKMRTMPDKVAATTLMEYFHFNEARRESGEIDL